LLQEAENECRASLKADPSQEGVERELGKVLVSRRDPSAAEVLRKAVTTNPKDFEALYFLGALLVGSDKLEDGIPILEQARTLNPGFWGNYFYLGRARQQMRDTAAAIPLLEKAAELNGSESSIYYQLGRAYAAAGKAALAKQAMDRVRELKARDLQAETAPN
jgi:tetratricopeptide (TPR) repeat protein